MAIEWSKRYLEWHYRITKWIPPSRLLPLLLPPMLLPSLNAELTLDPKGRVMLPRLLRNALELQGVNRLVALANAGPRGGLALMKVDDYEALAAQHQQGGPLDARSRLFALAIASTAHTVVIDQNGRVNLPGALCSLLGLYRDLYLFTAGSWVEIWDRPRWAGQAVQQAAAVWDQLYGFDSLLAPPAAAAGGAAEEG